MPGKPRAARPAKKPNSVPSPQEILPGLFLGGWKDAAKFDGTRFCVLDEAPDDMPAATQVTIYDEGKDAPLVANLDRLAAEVDAARHGGAPVLIFCGHGVRRAPLAMAWYLHRYEKLPLDRAYERIREVRPQVEAARDWIGNCRDLEP